MSILTAEIIVVGANAVGKKLLHRRRMRNAARPEHGLLVPLHQLPLLLYRLGNPRLVITLEALQVLVRGGFEAFDAAVRRAPAELQQRVDQRVRRNGSDSHGVQGLAQVMSDLRNRARITIIT